MRAAERLLHDRHYDGQWEALEATVERALVARDLGVEGAQADIDTAIDTAAGRYGDDHAVTRRLRRIRDTGF